LLVARLKWRRCLDVSHVEPLKPQEKDKRRTIISIMNKLYRQTM
jgi:hypothetical protein